MTERVVTVIAADDVMRWLEVATPEQVGLALKFGYANVAAVEKMHAVPAPVVEIAQVRGVRGETHVLAALRDEFHCEKVTGKTASGDITVWFDNVKLCVEVKNYSRPVPAAEVTKFLRDVETVGAHAGLFVSLGSRVTGVTDNFESRLYPVGGTSIPLIYIVADDAAMIVNAAKMVLAQARSRREAASMRSAAHAEVRGVDACVDMCAHARLQIYALAGENAIALSKIASSIQTAEGLGRECIERVGGVDPPSDHIGAIIEALPGHWTSTARKRNHPSGVTIDTGKKTPHLILPTVIARLHMDAILQMGGSITQEGASIPLTDGTIDGCLRLVK
jgi:hypothetical protein